MELPNITPKIRGDLLFYERRVGDEQGWIVKDPIQRNYYWFNQFQSWLLRRFDGIRTLVDVKREFEREFAPSVISERDLVGFLVQSSNDHLLVENVSGARLKSRQASFPQSLFVRLQSVFSIRLPAIGLKRPLDVAESVFGFLFSKTAFVVFFIAFFYAFALLLQNASVAWNDLQNAFQTPRFAIGFLIAISITKIFHEFGHAVACRRMGASCFEGGLMLLFFAPCLYCDVSDARIIEKKSKRTVVMLGGVYFELILATIAILIWANCDAVLVRNFLLNVAIIASVSTILVNLNPLMKFDGYYVFSEAAGIQNLSGKSQAAVRDYFRSLMFKIPKTKIPKSRIILGYGVASKVYRGFVYVGFFWLAYAISEQLGISAVVVGFGFLCCVAFVAALANQSVKTIAQDRSEFSLRPVRSVLLAAMLVSLLVVFFFVKIPSYIYCDAEIRCDGQLIAAPESGVLVSATEPGKFLAKEEVIATLNDDDLALASLDAMNQVTQIESSLATLSIKASYLPSVASKIPELTARLSAAKKNKLNIDRRICDFSIRAPFAGRIVSVADSGELKILDASSSRHGSLLDEQRLGQRVSSGDNVCFLARENAPKKIIIFVNEKKLDQVQAGQQVWIRPSGSIGTVLNCRVTGRQSQALRSSRMPDDRINGDGKQFFVSAKLEESDSNVRSTRESNTNVMMDRYLHRTPARARILASKQTPFQLVLRMMAETFQFTAIR